MVKALGAIKWGSLLTSTAMRYPNKIALVDGYGKKYTFRELNRRVNKLSWGLLKTGIKKGEFVSSLMYTTIEAEEIHAALAKIGAVDAPLVYRLSPPELVKLINNCDATTLIFGADFAGVVKEIKQNLTTVKYFICVGKECPSFAIPYEEVIEGQPDNEPAVEISDDDPLFLNYTSGTTGLPKAVLISHYNQFLAIFYTFIEPHNFTPEDVFLCGLPHYGRIGLGALWSCFIKGLRFVVMDFDPRKCLEVIERERVTFLMMAPIMSYRMLEELEKRPYDLSSVRGLSSVGSPLLKPIYEGIRDKITPNIWDYSGTQETAGNYIAVPEHKRKKWNTVGTPTHFCEVKIIDREGNEVPPGEIGEIIVRAPGAPAEYFKDPERTREEIKDGWFYVRDLGYRDEEGLIYLTGRTKDMIKTGGQQVMAPEIENLLMSHPAVADCAVVGLPDPEWGEVVTAVVLLKEKNDVTEEELIQFCRDKIAHFKAPKKVIFRKKPIPRNPTGKIQKFVLIQEYSQKV